MFCNALMPLSKAFRCTLNTAFMFLRDISSHFLFFSLCKHKSKITFSLCMIKIEEVASNWSHLSGRRARKLPDMDAICWFNQHYQNGHTYKSIPEVRWHSTRIHTCTKRVLSRWTLLHHLLFLKVFKLLRSKRVSHWSMRAPSKAHRIGICQFLYH